MSFTVTNKVPDLSAENVNFLLPSRLNGFIIPASFPLLFETIVSIGESLSGHTWKSSEPNGTLTSFPYMQYSANDLSPTVIPGLLNLYASVSFDCAFLYKSDILP